MFFQYLGTEPLTVSIPGDQNPVTIYPSEGGQKTSNEDLYKLLLSPDFEHKKLFKKAEGFVINQNGEVKAEPPVPQGEIKAPKKVVAEKTGEE